ncbi:MAG: hypothetical protein NTY12_04220 [Candidatus Falkowbacteria bacterium]|nr:hypothetical protein [Candidatus Falkowbacteria bacterium]
MLQIFGYISALLSIIAIIPYVRDIFRKKTKPERASWLIWTILGCVAFFSQLAKGAGDSLWLTGSQTLVVLFIFLLSIKYGVGGLVKKDIIAIIFTVLGLVIWYFTNNSAYALFMVIIISAIGVYLTIIKAYKEPATETTSTWFMSGTSGIFGAVAVGSFSFILLIYPIFIILTNYLVFASVLLGKNKLKSIA